MDHPAVVVTGASSGIGRAIAERLRGSGYQVFAGVRKLSAEKPAHPLWQEVLLDVTKPESLMTAKEEIASRLSGGGLAGLVNNAGIAEVGPLEFQDLAKFRAVFDVNVFGVVAATQTFLPLLHHGRGRIINIGSLGGLISIPFGASLCASKHAIEAVSDCLRLELYAAGIPVTCLQPASINSGSAEKLAARNEHTIAELPPEGQRRYADMLRRFMKATVESETHGSPPSIVADEVLAILRAETPPARRLVGQDGLLLKLAAKFLSDAVRDRFLRKVFLGSPVFASDPGRAS